MKGTVCIVDDHDDTRDSICEILKSYGVNARSHASPEGFLNDHPTVTNIDAVLFNLGDKEAKGVEVMKRLCNGHINPAVVVLTNNPINSSTLWAFLGGMVILQIPASGETIMQTIGTILGV